MRSSALAAPLLLLPLCWLPAVLLGGAGLVPPLLLVVPVVLAALRGGVRLGVPVALVAGVLAGPLTPADVSTGEAQAASDWLVRTGFFGICAAGMAVVFARLREESSEHQRARAAASARRCTTR